MVSEVGLHPISLDKEQHVLVGLFSEYKKIVSEDKELRRCDWDVTRIVIQQENDNKSRDVKVSLGEDWA